MRALPWRWFLKNQKLCFLPIILNSSDNMSIQEIACTYPRMYRACFRVGMQFVQNNFIQSFINFVNFRPIVFR